MQSLVKTQCGVREDHFSSRKYVHIKDKKPHLPEEETKAAANLIHPLCVGASNCEIETVLFGTNSIRELVVLTEGNELDKRPQTTCIHLNDEVRKEGISTVEYPSSNCVQEYPKMKSNHLGSHNKMNICCNMLYIMSKEKQTTGKMRREEIERARIGNQSAKGKRNEIKSLLLLF